MNNEERDEAMSRLWNSNSLGEAQRRSLAAWKIFAVHFWPWVALMGVATVAAALLPPSWSLWISTTASLIIVILVCAQILQTSRGNKRRLAVAHMTGWAAGRIAMNDAINQADGDATKIVAILTAQDLAEAEGLGFEAQVVPRPGRKPLDGSHEDIP